MIIFLIIHHIIHVNFNFFFYLNKIMDEYKIIDIRTEKCFSEKTFCGYLKKDVMTIFNKSLVSSKIEASCNWAIELLCSGYIDKIYEKFFTIIMKNININNLDLINIYYNRYMIYSRFKTKTNKLELRNQQNIRNHIVELCTLICLSLKSKSTPSIKITSEMFEIDFIKTRLAADNSTYIDKYYRFGDPLELKIFFNEFVYSLINMRLDMSMFWLFWLIEWEKRNIKKDKVYQCGYRSIENIDTKHNTDMVWIFWEILLNLNNNNYLNTLYKLYIYEYSPSKRQKKLPILLVAIKIYTEYKEVINSNTIDKFRAIIIQVCGNVNQLFIERKKAETGEKMDSVHESNLIKHNSNNLAKKKTNVSKNSVKKFNAISELDTFMLTTLSK